MHNYLLLTIICLALLIPSASYANLEDGIDAYNKQDYSTAFNEFHTLAETGDAKAQLMLGLMFDNALGTVRDYKQAFYWYKQSAEKSNKRAQFNVAEMLAMGQGTDQNMKQAVEWYTRAAEAGFAEAQYKLGLALGHADGTKQNLIEAYKWLDIAGNQDVEGSEIALKALDELKIHMKPGEVIEAEKRSKRWTEQFTEKQYNHMLEI